MARIPTTPSADRRRPSRLGVVARLAMGCLALAVGATVVACSSGSDPTQDAGATAETTSTTADPGTAAQTITQTLRLVEVAGGFDDPTAMVNRPMRNQLWVAERGGSIRAISIDTTWSIEAGSSVQYGFTVYPGALLDISGDVDAADGRGVLGIAFSTDARTLFVDYVDRSGHIVVAAWDLVDPPPPTTTTTTTTAPPAPPAADPDASTTTTTRAPRATTTESTTTTTTLPDKPVPAPIIDRGSRRILLRIEHPGPTYGGQLVLGRDGYLYLGVGDTSPSAGATNAPAQDPDSPLGKILRIDPGTPTLGGPFDIPSTNPYLDGGGDPLVYMLGVHDPKHFSFDRATGNLWLADPGAGRFQEIDRVTEATSPGANLGWPLVEGSERSANSVPDDLVTPVLVIPTADATACEIVGGFVYRGAQMADLRGIYLYGDRCGGAIRGLLQDKGTAVDDRALGASLPSGQLVGFGQDDRGELYVISASGSILRLAPT